MENTIEVQSAEVSMDILLEDHITRNGKSPNKNFLLEQYDLQSVMSELV